MYSDQARRSFGVTIEERVTRVGVRQREIFKEKYASEIKQGVV